MTRRCWPASEYVKVGVSGRIPAWKQARSFSQIQRFRDPPKSSMGRPAMSFPPIRLSRHDLPKKPTASGAAGLSGHAQLADRPNGSARLNTGRRFGPPRGAGRCERSRRAFYRSIASRALTRAYTLRESPFGRAGMKSLFRSRRTPGDYPSSACAS